MVPNLFGSSAPLTSPAALRGGDKPGARVLNAEKSSRADDFSALVDRAATVREPRPADATRPAHTARPAHAAKPSPGSPSPRGTHAARSKADTEPASSVAGRKPAARADDTDAEPVKAHETDESKTVDVAAPVGPPAPVLIVDRTAGNMGNVDGTAPAAGDPAQAETLEPAQGGGVKAAAAAPAEPAPEGAAAADSFAELDSQPAEEPAASAEPSADAARAAANAARLAKLISQSGATADEPGRAAASRAAADTAGREAGRPAANEETASSVSDAASPAVANIATSTTPGFAFNERGDRHTEDPRTTAAMPGVMPATGAPSTFALAAPLVSEAATTSPSQTPGAETMNQLVQSMRTQFRNGIGEAVVRLNPDHLGAVSISLRVERGTVTASVAAESPSVRAWLESQEQTLRQNLAGQGLNLDRLVVHPDGREQARQQDEQHSQRRQQRRTPDPDAPIFEIIV